MKRDAALAILKAHAPELQELGVISLSLFGSTACDEAGEASDVDVAVRLTPGSRGEPHLDRMDQLRTRLSAILACPVDVVEEPTTRPRIQRERDRHLPSNKPLGRFGDIIYNIDAIAGTSPNRYSPAQRKRVRSNEARSPAGSHSVAERNRRQKITAWVARSDRPSPLLQT